MNKLKSRIETKFGKEIRIVIMTTLGGLIFGIVGYILPLTPGDGGFQMNAVMTSGTIGTEIPSSILVVSSYAKMFCYWISVETGFVGGIFHPLLMISLLFGRMILNQLDISEILGTAISFILLAAAFCPIPYSMFLLDLSKFMTNAYVNFERTAMLNRLRTEGGKYQLQNADQAVLMRQQTELAIIEDNIIVFCYYLGGIYYEYI